MTMTPEEILLVFETLLFWITCGSITTGIYQWFATKVSSEHKLTKEAEILSYKMAPLWPLFWLLLIVFIPGFVFLWILLRVGYLKESDFRDPPKQDKPVK